MRTVPRRSISVRILSAACAVRSPVGNAAMTSTSAKPHRKSRRMTRSFLACNKFFGWFISISSYVLATDIFLTAPSATERETEHGAGEDEQRRADRPPQHHEHGDDRERAARQIGQRDRDDRDHGGVHAA